jgi:hypothetical protein
MPSAARLSEALARLELLAEPATQELLHSLEREGPADLSSLSRRHRISPYRIQQRLRRLKSMDLVFSPKRFPRSFAVNQYRWLQLRLSIRVLVKDVSCEEN